MDYFNNLYVFQRKAALQGLAISDRIVYLNLLARANLEDSEDFEMTLNELAYFTGLPKTTVHVAKNRLKLAGFIKFDKYRISIENLVDDKLNFDVQRKVPHLQRKKTNVNPPTSNSAGARVKNSEPEHSLTITEPANPWL